MPDTVMSRVETLEVLDLLDTAEFEAGHGSEAHRALWQGVARMLRTEANLRWGQGRGS